LLRSARAAIDRGDAASALRLLDQYRAQHPKGTLRQEELANRVLALCALGNKAAARTAAAELERQAPDSPHLARVRGSCAGPGQNEPQKR
jgi:hypothetical protein